MNFQNRLKLLNPTPSVRYMFYGDHVRQEPSELVHQVGRDRYTVHPVILDILVLPLPLVLRLLFHHLQPGHPSALVAGGDVDFHPETGDLETEPWIQGRVGGIQPCRVCLQNLPEPKNIRWTLVDALFIQWGQIKTRKLSIYQ